MKTTTLGILLLFWFIFTLILACSVIGMFVLMPVPNTTAQWMPMTDDRRSTWMLIGLDIKRKLLNI
jgi:hypothetical protein